MPITVAALASSSPVSASDSAAASEPGEAASMNAVSIPSASSSSLHGKPLLVVKSEEQPVVASDARKKARYQPSQNEEQAAENAENLQPESLENLQLKKISPQQRAENEFQKANLAMQEGRANDALAGYEAALLIDSSHKAARRAWVGVLLSLKRNDDAERVLQRGIKRDPKDTSFAMLQARLQVERGAVPLALETLQKALPYAEGQADYQAFVAALFQRQSLHDEAIAHYQIALKLVPNKGIWLMGLGISLQVLQRKEEARDAFQRALNTNTLNAQLQAFVQQKLKEL
jgi:MSHA biogenesis protein MshN